MSLDRPRSIVEAQPFGPEPDAILDPLTGLSRGEIAWLAQIDQQMAGELQRRIGFHVTEREREDCEGSLIAFFKRAWREIEHRPLSLNWHHEVIAEHLTALAYGEIRHLVINVPPRHTKSILVNVLFPAWLWCRSEIMPLSGPHVKFLSVSYAAALSEKLATDMRRLVMGDWYQSLWGDKVRLLPDQMSRANFGTTAGGERMSASIEGGLLGRGGDIQICFPFDEIIWTEFGPKSIGDVVRDRRAIRVWSFNRDRKQAELRRLTGWHTNPGRSLLRIVTDRGSIRCTDDHRILTRDGYVEARALTPGTLVVVSRDMPPSSPRTDRVYGTPPDAEPAADCLSGLRGAQHFSGLVLSEFWGSGLLANCGKAKMPPYAAGPNRGYGGRAYAIQRGEDAGWLWIGCDLAHHLLGEVARTITESAVVLTILDILQPGAILQIVKTAIARVPVAMAHLLSWRWWSKECSRDDDMNLSPEFLSGSVDQTDMGVIIPLLGCGPQNFAVDRSMETLDLAERAGFVELLEPWDGKPAFLRVIGIERVHEVPQLTYCVSVEHNANMVVGRHICVIVANCDDPQTRKGADSDAERAASLQAMSDLMTRVTDPRIAAKVLIMQRLHLRDATDWALTNWPRDTVHLMFPARFEPDRACDQDPRTKAGELLWPEVWNNTELTKIERGLAALDGEILSSYAVSGQMQQNPTPRGGGIINKDDWAIWPEWTPNVGDMKVLADGTAFIPLPEVSRVILSIDTAMSEKETADWNACIVYGVWHRPRHLVQIVGQLDNLDDGEQPRVVVMGAWRRRCKLNDDTLGPDGKPQGLVQRIIETARRFNADEVVIEDTTRGKDVKNEIERQLADMPFLIRLFNPKKHGDKVGRLNSVQPLHAQRLVYMPGNCRLMTDRAGTKFVQVDEFAWSREVMAEVESLPHGAHDDYCDCHSQALLVLREDGYLALTQEYVSQQVAARMFHGRGTTVRDSYGV